VVLHHETHLHDLGVFTGADTSFTPLTDHDADSFYTVTLTVTDGDGIATTQSVNVRPQTVALTLDSTPAGAPLAYAGTSVTAPYTGRAPCRWWSWRTRRLRRGSCAAAAWIRAKLKPASTAWTVWLGGPLPPGRYVLLVRAFGRDGSVTYGAGGHARLALRM